MVPQVAGWRGSDWSLDRLCYLNVGLRMQGEWTVGRGSSGYGIMGASSERQDPEDAGNRVLLAACLCGLKTVCQTAAG